MSTPPVDAIASLGKIIDDTYRRDAVHIAVLPMQATYRMRPGDEVIGSDSNSIGIVDPFLKVDQVEPGQWFWCLLHPRTITTLRHVWTHPAIPDESAAPVTARLVEDDPAYRRSQLWIYELCDRIGCTFPDLMDAARAWVNYGDYWNEGARWDGHPGIPEEFWVHYEVVARTSVSPQDRANFFTCSC